MPSSKTTRRNRKSRRASSARTKTRTPLRLIENGAASALAVKPRVACDMLDVGVTRLYELIEAGELTSYKDGRSRKITTESIRAYVSRKVGVSAGAAARGA